MRLLLAAARRSWGRPLPQKMIPTSEFVTRYRLSARTAHGILNVLNNQSQSLSTASSSASASSTGEKRPDNRRWKNRRKRGKKSAAGASLERASTGRPRKVLFDGPFPPKDLDVFISCLPGLESILSSELSEKLNLENKASVGRVSLLSPTTIDDLLLCNLHLGTASNVLLKCGNPFSARGLAELRRKVSLLPWEDLLEKDIYLDTRVSSTKSKLYHTTAIQDRIAAGIYESLGHDNVPTDYSHKNDPLVGGLSSSDGGDDDDGDPPPVVALDVRIIRDQVQIFLKASPTPLHQRGYRLQTAKAPLREDLAYAMLWTSGWMMSSDNAALLDPFCGSGTIAIEAAATVAGLPPGRLRPAPFQGTKIGNTKQWSELVVLDSKPPTVASNNKDTAGMVGASDRDAGAIDACKGNAERAGVLNFMDIRQSAMSSHPWLKAPDKEAPPSLLLATNPPFGERVSRDPTGNKQNNRHLLPLYQRLNHRISALEDSGCQLSTVLLSNSPSLVKRAGLPLEIGFKSMHGGIPIYAMVSKDDIAKTKE